MCLLGIEFGRFEDFPVLVLANREESFARPSSAPRWYPPEGAIPGWMGGVDLVAGGTWLGLNTFGILVAVTNRKKHGLPANPVSRGFLCRQLLAGRETTSVMDAAWRELSGGRFAGCNVLIADRNSVSVVEAGDTLKMTRLHPGLHLLANAEPNDPLDPRIERVRQEFSLANADTADAWFRAARHICSLSALGDAPAICLSGSDRGTVSSTVLGLGRSLPGSRYWFAPGPPNLTTFDDYTPLLCSIFEVPPTSAGQAGHDDFRENISQTFGTLSKQLPDIEPPADSPARRAVRHSLTGGVGNLHVPEPAENSPYRILLRGPWQAERLDTAVPDGAELGDCPTIVTSTIQRPAPATVRLPASWQDLFGTFRGRIRFCRKFHPPSNITAADRLTIVFDGVGGGGTVSLNGSPLGSIKPDAGTARFDVTSLLRTNNELQVELEFNGHAADTSPGGLFAPVVLEIQSGR